jgi:prepilin-type N-terminal cleavage/methylation domain-containing protein
MSVARMRRHGFTMVEMVISLFVLAMMALALGSATIQARKMSEAAVYKGTAMAAASGYMEQLKSMEYQQLINSITDKSIPLPTKLDQGTSDPLIVGVENSKKITIDVNSSGEATKTMDFIITPELTNLEPTLGLRAIEIKLRYKWKAPGSNSYLERGIRSVRSYVPTF